MLLPIEAAAEQPPAVSGNANAASADVVTIARFLLLANDWPQAIRLLDHATAVAPEDPDVWFLLGLARRQSSNEQAAADAFRQASLLEPTQARPLLELGKSLTDIGDYEGARDAFDHALRLADNRAVRHNIRKYLKLIDQNRTLTYWIGARMQPDTNPSAASGQKTVIINGMRFVLNNQTQSKAAYGLGADMGVRYAPRLNEQVRLVTDIGYNGVHFPHACCSDDTWGVATGPGWWWQGLHVVSQAYARYRMYDGSGYSTEDGIRLETGLDRQSYAISIGGEGGSSRLLGPALVGGIARGFMSADLSLTDTVTVGTTLRYERDSYPLPSQAFTAKSVETRLAFPGPWKLPVNIWAAFLARDYDGATLTSNGTRLDQLITVGASVELDFFTLWGVSPSLGVADETQKSTDQLGRFNRLQLLFGFTKVF
jgi:tetratricopeptide (TPR) repeat protein